MRLTIGMKIFGIAVGLLVLMTAAALLSMRMTRTVDAQLATIDHNYFPAYVALAQANIRSVEQSAYARRLLLALVAGQGAGENVDYLRRRVANAGKASDGLIAAARRHINEQIADPLDFDDNVTLARLDERIESLQEDRRQYETVLAEMLAAAAARDETKAQQRLVALNQWRDDIDAKLEAERSEMRQLASAAIVGTRAYQRHVVEIGLALLAIAGLLGLTLAAAVTLGLVRPVRRLVAGTTAVEGGALDITVPITSHDEIGRLTGSFNRMVAELRVKAKIRELFGKYVDPRIVEGLIDRPELTDVEGSRREMTILFCDMKGFTSFSEGLTPVALVNVLNRYMTLMSDPVRRSNGIIDKYIGDAIMAFWGPPFTSREEQGDLACLAAFDQIAALEAFRTELRAHGAPTRHTGDRHPHRHRYRGCGGRQHRLRTDAQLHGDRRHGESGVAPPGGQQDLRHAHSRRRSDEPAGRCRGRDAGDRRRALRRQIRAGAHLRAARPQERGAARAAPASRCLCRGARGLSQQRLGEGIGRLRGLPCDRSR